MNKKILAAIILLTNSCSQIGYYQDYVNASKLLVGYDSVKITKEEFEKRQYSFAKVNIGRSQGIIMSLVKFDPERKLSTWYSGDSSYLVTDSFGRIVELSGLDHSLRVRNINNKESSNKIFLVDFPSEQLFGMSVIELSTKEYANKSFIYLGNKTKTLLVRKKMYAKDIDWNYLFESRYLDGKLVESKQEAHPFLPKIKIEFYFK
jgi:hypothetical protein